MKKLFSAEGPRRVRRRLNSEKPGKEIRLKIEKTMSGDRIGARGLNIRNRKRNQEGGERSRSL